MRALSSFFKDASGRTCFKQQQFAPDIFGEPRLITEAILVLKVDHTGEVSDEKPKEYPREYKQFVKSQVKEPEKIEVGKED